MCIRDRSNKNVDDESRISVNLNGKSLGHTKLNKSRKTVSFNIPEGTLHGADNVLTITPDLNLAKVTGCNFNEKLPGFFLGESSKIKIKTPLASPVAELSKMTATGAPFSVDQGKDTLIVLPAGSSRDYAASLKVLAKLAKTSGGSWTEANYMRSTNYASMPPEKNILFIGPSSSFKGALRKNAPKGLSSALKGQAITGIGRVASIDKFASNNEFDAIRLTAARQAKTGRIRQGGVAALYASPLADDKVMGVITNVPGSSFANTANHMIKPTHWNSLEGSVARWNKSNVLMAQTAIAIPDFVSAPKLKKINFSDMTSEFSFPEFDMPSLDMSFFSLEDFDTELAKSRIEDFRVKTLTWFSEINIDDMASKMPWTQNEETSADEILTPKSAAVTLPNYVPPQSKTVQISVPNLRRSIIDNTAEVQLELRGFSEVKPASATISQKGQLILGNAKSWFENKSAMFKDAWHKRFAKSDVQAPKSSAKVLEDTKVSKEGVKSLKEIIARPNLNMDALIARFGQVNEFLLIFIFGGFFLLLGLSAPNTVREEESSRPFGK